MALTRTNLPNGTQLHVLAPFNSELATLSVVVHVGFAHETREKLGISHMVEHLCFSDNDRHSFQQLRAGIERLGGTFNRAFDLLRLRHGLAYGTGCYVDTLRDGGLLLLTADVKRGDEERAGALLASVLEDLQREAASEEEIDGIRTKLLGQYARKNAVPDWYAHELTAGVFGDYETDVDDYPARLRAVTPASAADLLRRLLGERGRIDVRQSALLSVPAAVCAALGILLLLVALFAKWVLR